jgi:hypothetical protein
MMDSLMKGTRTLSLILLAVLSGLAVLTSCGTRPPREKEFIDGFYAHQASYETLRDLLLEDEQLVRVAAWGVETTASPPHEVRPQGDFPINRYNQYLALLNQIGARWAFRASGEKPELVAIGVWASGWGADTRHIEICWMNQVPARRIDSLDDYYQTPKPRRPAFRQIEGNWYLYADW